MGAVGKLSLLESLKENIKETGDWYRQSLNAAKAHYLTPVLTIAHLCQDTMAPPRQRLIILYHTHALMEIIPAQYRSDSPAWPYPD